jgi:trypsin
MSTILLAVLSTSTAAPPPPPIVDGDTTDDFRQVGVLVMDFSGYGAESFCSGTLIHKRWVLTAAHCLTDIPAYINYGAEIYFYIGSDMYGSGGIELEMETIDWIEHPDYDARELKNDIGLVELAEALPMRPMPLNEESPGMDWQDEPLTYVGWGVTHDNGNDSGVKRFAEIPYYEHDDQFVYAFDNGGSNVCYGDSGGAGLVGNPDDGYALAGVNSFVYPSCVGGYSGATRVDRHIDWIGEHVPLEENIFSAEDVVLDELLAGGSEADDEGPLDGGSSSDKASAGGCSTAPMSGSLVLALLGLLSTTRRRE